MCAFVQIFDRWKSIRERFQSNLHAEYFRKELTAAPAGSPLFSWFRACQLLAAGETVEPDDALTVEMWERVAACLSPGASAGGNDIKQAALLMLACARALKAAGAGSPGDAVWKALASPTFPARAVKEIADALRPSDVTGAGVDRGIRRIVQLPVVLLSEGAGRVGTLELDLMSGGSGVFYPAVEMLMVGWDGDFADAWESARLFLESRALWPAGCDVRWRFAFLKGEPRPFRSGSLGAAFGFGSAWLAATHGLVPPSPDAAWLCRIQHPESICFSGALSPEGALNGMVEDGVMEKIEAVMGCSLISFLILPRTTLPCVLGHLRAYRAMHSPFAFLRLRGPNTANLTLLLESAIL